MQDQNEFVDDGTPLRSLIRCRWALVEFNHRADEPLTMTEAREAVAYLTEFGAMLEQAYRRIDRTLRGLQGTQRISIGYGSPHEGDPAAAVTATTAALREAVEAAQLMCAALGSVQELLRHARTGEVAHEARR